MMALVSRLWKQSAPPGYDDCANKGIPNKSADSEMNMFYLVKLQVNTLHADSLCLKENAFEDIPSTYL